MIFECISDDIPPKMKFLNMLSHFFVRGPWVAYLRMTVSKGIGKHISTQSQAINLIFRQNFPI